MKKYDIAIIGGDKRTACMAQVFPKKGLRVVTYGIVKTPKDTHAKASTFQEAVDSAKILVFGIPFQSNGYIFFENNMPPVALTEFQRCLRKHHQVFGGVIPDNFKRLCEKREIGCYDFMTDETLTIFNAIATAEGAIAEALLHRNTNLHHSRCMVLGYGRCGMVLADKLLGLNAHVTVCCEDTKELARADSLGMDTLPLTRLRHEIQNFEYIFNTIPAQILREDSLQAANSEMLIIDIASAPGGVNYEAATRLNIPAFHCSGLPGKYAGQSSAERLAEYVMQKIV